MYDNFYNADDDKVTLDTEALLEVLTHEFDLPEQDADFLLQCHAEEVIPVPAEQSYFEAAKALLAASYDWGGEEDLLDLDA